MTDRDAMSRREFAAAVSAIAVASMTTPGTLPAMQTTASTQPLPPDPATRLEWLEQSLGRAIPDELRGLVAEQIRENDQMWRRGRGFPVPDGTEPATVFQPLAKR